MIVESRFCMNIAQATISRMANWRERDVIGPARLAGRLIYRPARQPSQQTTTIISQARRALGEEPGAPAIFLFDYPGDQQEQIGVAGLLPGGGDQRMRLSAMMRLMVEEMRDEQPFRRADFTLRRAAEPHQILIEPVLVDLRGPGRDVGVGPTARLAQLGKVLDE